MPELPEVQTAATELGEAVTGRRIVEVERLDHPAMVETPTPDDFVRLVRGRRIEAVERRAKWIVVRLDGGWTLAVHLRMTGVLRAVPPGEAPDAHTHLVLALDDGQRIFFRDTRKFGRVRLLDAEGMRALDEAHGLEPLSPAFTAEALSALLAGRRVKLKTFLLDQSLVAGIGNIYADESLHQAGLHPLKAADTVTPDEVSRLHSAVRAVLERAIARKARYWEGPVRAHEDFDDFDVYDRTGEPCRTCGGAIARMTVSHRGTHFCPVCQPAP